VIILDTNVLSEPMRPTPSEAVRRWVIAQRQDELFTTSITEAEMMLGVAEMAAGKRRSAMHEQVRMIFDENLGGHILAFDSRAAMEIENLPVRRTSKGDPILDPDILIAAIARANSATLATRNVKHFHDCGISLVNPWDTPP
jgi:predicted nucleic acid-binding protein